MQAKLHALVFCLFSFALPACERRAPAAVEGLSHLPPSNIHGIGYIEPVSEVRRLAFKNGGVVNECRVEIGQRVMRGEILVTLQNEREAAELAAAESEEQMAQAECAQLLAGVNAYQIRAAESELAFAKCEVEFSQREVERQRQLSSARVSSTTELDQAETNAQRREAAVHRAESVLAHLKNYVTKEDRGLAEAKVATAAVRVRSARQRLADTVLHAPSDGTILEILRREGESVHEMAPEPVLIFGDLSRLRVRAEIDESYAAAVHPGQRATASGGGLGDQTTIGTVQKVKPLMGKKTVFARSAGERKDLDVIQVFIEMPPDFRAPIGLEVDIVIESEIPAT